MQFSNKTYDALKWLVQILIPALAAAYLALANVWSLPYANEVVASLTILDLFLGTVLGISNTMYLKSIADDGALFKFMTTLSDTELDRVKELVALNEKKKGTLELNKTR